MPPTMPDKRTTKMAVYGTLKRGGSNHHFLRDACYLGEEWLSGLRLYDLGPYPGVCREGKDAVLVEIYRINAQELALIDHLEDHRPRAPAAGEYRRCRMRTGRGLAWLYLINRKPDNSRLIESGVWQG